MATPITDDGFHEIQLNGKQLVFLFMAATVVSVVIFLCGVLVGRGVKGERIVVGTNDGGAGAMLQDTATTPQPAPPAAATVTTTANNFEPASVQPPTPADEKFSYSDLLDEGTKKETLKAPVAAPKPPASAQKAAAPAPALPVTPAPKETPKETKAPVETKTPVAAKAPAAVPASRAVPAAAPVHADGYAIQVAALREPSEADTIAKRLVSKGYDAYVLTPPGGTPNVYRVRVGSFKTRRDAEPVAAKLQQEEQFKPWITR
jgi:cell division septation protein DedD